MSKIDNKLLFKIYCELIMNNILEINKVIEVVEEKGVPWTVRLPRRVVLAKSIFAFTWVFFFFFSFFFVPNKVRLGKRNPTSKKT